jgi:eukaryotic-like serine/threonine-protein kinase
MVRPPFGTVTFLFTAIEGSAAPGGRSTTGARERHDLAMRNAAEGHGGYVFRMGGDGSSATAFQAAGPALEAALEAQRILSNEDGGGLQVRMALHTGVAGESDGDYVGPPLSRVAGLLAAGHGGQILMSAVTHGLVQDNLGHLAPGARLRYLGEHRMGDLGHTESIFQLVVPCLPEVFPPLRTHGLVDTVSASDTPQPQGLAHTTVSDQVLGDGRYQRRRLLGSGGMANVYLARDRVLDRDVAIKVLRHEYASNAQFVERFKREARSAASLSNPNIVGIYDRGETEDGTYYIVMEYVAGTTLEDRIRDQGPLSSAASATVALRVAQALQVAHRRGIIHRDVKPQNILLGESGEVKVTDFGIAQAATLATLTLEGSVMGTPHYISPEQAQGEEARSQSDLYSLGVVLYEMLTGELPFKVDTPVGVVMQHIHGQAHPPRELNPEIPELLNDITMRLLAKDPATRYPDAAELIEDLRRMKRRDLPTVAVGEQTGPGGSDSRGSRITRHEGGIVPPPPPGEYTGDGEDNGGRRKSLPWALAVAGLVAVAMLIIVPYILRGQEMLRAPSLVGQELPAARKNVGDLELVKAEERHSAKQVGTILEQDPKSGARVARGAKISVVISAGPEMAAVPSVVGKPRKEAEKLLRSEGLDVKFETEKSSEENAGRVVGQSPSGSKLKPNSTVVLTVGEAPTDYALVKDPAGALSMEVPSGWSDRLVGAGSEAGASWSEFLDVSIGFSITASKDISSWSEHGRVPGVYAVASSRLTKYSNDLLLGSGPNEPLSSICASEERRDFDRGSYSGKLQEWNECEGGADQGFITLSAAPEGRACVILLQIGTVDEASREHARHILDTFHADCQRIAAIELSNQDSVAPSQYQYDSES